MSSHLNAKTDSILGRERGPQVSPDASVASMSETHRQALLGTLDTYDAAFHGFNGGSASGGGGASQAPSPDDTVDPPDEVAARAVSEGPAQGFRLIKKISQGGVGEVWEGRQHSLHRIIALKRLRDNIPPPADLSPDEQEKLSRAAFIQEALIAASLAHPNVIPVYDLGVDDAGAPVLAMKLVEGRVWADALLDKRHEPGALRENLEILLQVCNAVAFAHSRNVVHRDLKPAQVMLGEFGEVLLMDWGLAIDSRARAEIGPEGSVAPPRDEACSPAGTPVYMAPEQVQDIADAVGERTDVYLLGAILYEILVGEPPHAADTVEQALERAHAGYVEPPRERVPHLALPSALCDVAMRALSARIEDRHENAKQFADAIESFLAGETRREESGELFEQAQRDYQNAARGEYLELARIDANLTRALVLWPENQPAAELRQRVLREYAASAVAAGDLKLAQLIGAHFDSAEDVLDLREQIALAERRRARHDRQRRLAMGAVATLVASLLAMGWTLYGVAARGRGDAERGEALALDAANTAISTASRAMTRPLAGAPGSRVEEIENLKKLFEELRRHFPPSPRQEAERARLMIAAFEIYNSHGSPREAALQLLEAVQSARKAADADPGNVEYAELLVDAHLRLAQLHAEGGEVEAAFRSVKDAREGLARLESSPGASEASRKNAILKLRRAALLIEGKAWLADGSIDKALPFYVQSVEAARTLAATEDSRATNRALQESLASLANANEALRDPEEAEANLDELLRAAERRASAWEDDPQAQRDLALAYEAMHAFLYRSGRTAKAEQYLERALARERQVVERYPANLEYRWNLGQTLLRSAEHYLLALKLDTAEKKVEEALEILERVAKLMPPEYGGAAQTAHARLVEARVKAAQGRPQEAHDAIDLAMRLANDLLAEKPGDEEALARMGEILAERARIAASNGDFEEAMACYHYWMDREPLYLKAAKDRTGAELESIKRVAAYVKLFDGQPFVERADNQLPIMRALADKMAAFSERGPEALGRAESLREDHDRLRMRIQMMESGADPDAPEAPPAWNAGGGRQP